MDESHKFNTIIISVVVIYIILYVTLFVIYIIHNNEKMSFCSLFLRQTVKC